MSSIRLGARSVVNVINTGGSHLAAESDKKQVIQTPVRHLSQLMRSWYFLSSVNSIFKRAFAAIQGARCQSFGLTLRLLPYFMCANSEASDKTARMNSEGSGEIALMRRLAWTFAVRICDKYHYLMSWLICYWPWIAVCQIKYFLGYSCITEFIKRVGEKDKMQACAKHPIGFPQRVQ